MRRSLQPFLTHHFSNPSVFLVVIHRFIVFAEGAGKLTGSVAACHKIKKPFIGG
ncbi:MAG: hypothetical protein Ct9H90mP8_2720 [Pseudomonadota bacterium]|nr:MAG: hypothetical protein Ct9H90mP8_2720 [Pseudomonadota bacterium]